MNRLLTIFLILCAVSTYAQSDARISSHEATTDLNEAIRLIDAVHFNPYLHIDSVIFHQKKEELIKEFQLTDSIEKRNYVIRVKQLLAELNDGHTSLSVIFPEMMEARFIPISFKADLQSQKLFNQTDSRNAEINTINGVNAMTLFEESLTLYGGNENFRKAFSESILFAIYLHLDGYNPPFNLTYADGTEETISQGIDIRELSNMQRPSSEDYSFEILENQIGYLAYNSCNDAKAFEQFLKETFKEIDQKNIDNLIIDIRENSGGNSGLNDLLLPYISGKSYRQSSSRHWRVSKEFQERIHDPIYAKYWGKSFIKIYAESPVDTILREDEYGLRKPKKPKHFFKGKSCMLIGPKTFSSANFLADAVATYNLTTLIGSDTGEDTNDFGEQITFQLPETGLSLQVTIAFDIGADGNSDKLEPVHPDIPIEGDALPYAVNWILQAQ